MLRGLEARVDRVGVPLRHAERAAIGRRVVLRAHAEICAFVRAAAAEAAIDPARISALRLGDEAAAELAALGDTPALRESDLVSDRAGRRPGEHERAAEQWESKLARLAADYADGSHPDPERDALISWHAWAPVRQSGPPHPARPDKASAPASA